jgi:hypothetical protein
MQASWFGYVGVTCHRHLVSRLSPDSGVRVAHLSVGLGCIAYDRGNVSDAVRPFVMLHKSMGGLCLTTVFRRAAPRDFTSAQVARYVIGVVRDVIEVL